MFSIHSFSTFTGFLLSSVLFPPFTQTSSPSEMPSLAYTKKKDSYSLDVSTTIHPKEGQVVLTVYIPPHSLFLYSMVSFPCYIGILRSHHYFP